MVKQSGLSDESGRKRVQSFDFAAKELLSFPNFMQKTEFRAKALKRAKFTIDLERDRGNNTKFDVVARAVMGEAFIALFFTRGGNIFDTLLKNY